MTSTRKPSEGTRSTSAVAGVEIKVTIRGDQELKGIRALELNEDSAEVRVIYFYDTPSLDLFNAGVVLRARLVKGTMTTRRSKSVQSNPLTCLRTVSNCPVSR